MLHDNNIIKIQTRNTIEHKSSTESFKPVIQIINV